MTTRALSTPTHNTPMALSARGLNSGADDAVEASDVSSASVGVGIGIGIGIGVGTAAADGAEVVVREREFLRFVGVFPSFVEFARKISAPTELLTAPVAAAIAADETFCNADGSDDDDVGGVLLLDDRFFQKASAPPAPSDDLGETAPEAPPPLSFDLNILNSRDVCRRCCRRRR